jgi:beta-glucanase (GH16 family)
MNLKLSFLSICALLTIGLTFENCGGQDDVKKNTGSNNPPVVIVPDPPTNDIPSTAPTTCDYDVTETDLTSIGWKKVFEDNFDGDLSKWNTWTGGAYNNELQYYQPANIKLEDGILTIAAKEEKVTGATTPYDNTSKSFDYTSGRIESKTLFSANSSTSKVRIMARIKLPLGYGLWPAFWVYGDPWPTQGEIDFIEARGQDTLKYQTNYFYGDAANANLVSGAEKVITADADLTDCYHVYEVIWEQNKLISLLDGAVVEVKTSGGYIPSMFGKQQKIVLNLAVGGAFFSGLDPEKIKTNSLSVDWVKVFTGN